MTSPRTDASTAVAAVPGTFPVLTERESRHSVAALDHHGVGIDRLSISFRVRGWVELGRWDAVTRWPSGDWSAQTNVGDVGTPQVMVGVRSRAHGVFGKVECNPARFADPGGCSLLPPGEVFGALNVMWAAALEVLQPDSGVQLADAAVKRVDAARDFRGIMNPGLYVDGLEPFARPYARRKGVWSDAKAGNAQTLHVGSGAGMVRLYDQHAAYARKGAPPGSLRWECEARPGWLEPFGVRRVRDLDPVVINDLVRRRWSWSRMGETVTGPVSAVQVAMGKVRSGEVKRRTAAFVLGEMMLQSFGYGVSSDRTARHHRALMAEIGLTADALWSNELDRQASGRLDFESGTELLELTS